MITFLPLDGYDYICQLRVRITINQQADINVWLNSLGNGEDYVIMGINAHQAVYFKYEDDMLAFKLKFGKWI